MACTSLIGLPIACGNGGVFGGVEKLYVLAYADMDGDATLATNGLVSAIPLKTGKKFVEVGVNPRSAGLNHKSTSDIPKGLFYYTQTMTVVLTDFTSENQTFVDSVRNQPVVAIVKMRSGKYLVAGLDGQFKLSADEGGTGTAEGDLNGSTLTFEGTSKNRPALVDETIIDTLTA